jgi:hypothetical protein
MITRSGAAMEVRTIPDMLRIVRGRHLHELDVG